MMVMMLLLMMLMMLMVSKCNEDADDETMSSHVVQLGGVF